VLDDRYEVVKKLARGGMATVYVANDLRLSRTVAIKVMNDGLGDSDDFAARFDTEARAAAHLSHANVVSVFDQGTDAGRPYIVMEYVQGFTLRQLITRSPTSASPARSPRSPTRPRPGWSSAPSATSRPSW
jgi:serine/threonine-protein kinase